jgi:hypothetical protein
MKIVFPLALVTAVAICHADDSVRSTAFKAADNQTQILSDSTSVVAQLDAILEDMSRNGISDETKAAVTIARANLAGASSGAITTALSQLREISVSGNTDHIQRVVENQREAEITLRQIAVKLAEKQFTEGIAATSTAILDRQDRALSPQSEKSAAQNTADEQKAIALQVQDLSTALSTPPENLPPELAAIVKAASEKAKALGLTTKANAAAADGRDKVSRQKELRSALAEVDQVLSQMVPAKERLENAAAALAKLQKDQAALAASAAPDSNKANALVSEANAVARKVASESPAAAKALDDASKALAANTPDSQAAATKALAEAASALTSQLAREKAAEETSLAQAASDLQKMATEAASLAASLRDLDAQANPSQPDKAAKQKAIASSTESLQSRSAPLSPEAAGSLAQAKKEIESGNTSAAAKALDESSQKLASQAAAAQSASAENARLEAMQAALAKAAEGNASVGEAIKSGKTGEAAGKALKNKDQLSKLAQTAEAQARQDSPTDQPAQAALDAAAKAIAGASTAALQSAQSAAQGKLSAAQEANTQAGKALDAASQSLAQRQKDLREQAGLASDSTKLARSNSQIDAFGGMNDGSQTAGNGDSNSKTGRELAFEIEKGFSPKNRKAMAELRKTPVPPEFSGAVQAYFEQLAAE